MSETVDLSLELLDVQLIDFSRLPQVLVLLGEHMDLVLKGFDDLGHSVKLSAHGVVLFIELFVLINHEFYAVIKHKATYG
jgi:hypothetical protein